MTAANKLNAVALTEEKSLKTLVENRSAFTLESCELNIFETHQASHMVPLTFNDFVITSMLRGKKVMHLFDEPGFDYVPGETVLVPGGVTMEIDFPEASKKNPTQCVALAIDNQMIQQTLHKLNERYPREGNATFWQLHKSNYHFLNNMEVAQLVNKMINICSGTSVCKDALADITLQELLISIVQLQNLQIHDTGAAKQSNSNPMSFIMAYIKANITEDIKLDALSTKACMSKATFYRAFKREFGIAPLEYILSERVKMAKRLLTESGSSIKVVSYECGFSDVNYFIRLFKQVEGITPKQYQLLSSRLTFLP